MGSHNKRLFPNSAFLNFVSRIWKQNKTKTLGFFLLFLAIHCMFCTNKNSDSFCWYVYGVWVALELHLKCKTSCKRTCKFESHVILCLCLIFMKNYKVKERTFISCCSHIHLNQFLLSAVKSTLKWVLAHFLFHFSP